ncbi:IS1380 family transposase [Pelobacter seleniigenes]|uniref:IS1380 family transposase n=1 Tax=Pelobacter seleniigenes TaxID=407188 RepID=UPI0004A6EE37|nr:IS1380 family transposase [Pelobacter seleniigenes]
MTFPRFKIEQSKQEFYTSNSGLALTGVALNRFTTLTSRVDKAAPKRGIATSDVVRSYLGLLCQGKSDFAAIRPFFEDDEFFRCSLGLTKVPSPETLRQRLDQFAEVLRTIVDFCSVEFLKKAKAQLSPLSTGHMPLDLDVFTLDNSDTKKEGVSYTYRGFNGYAPLGVWLGLEGWCLEIEHRPGSQHAQAGFVPLLLRSIRKARELSEAPLLVRLDSAHDAIATLVSLKEAEADFIVKWNRRNSDMPIKATDIFAHGKRLKDTKTERIAIMTETVERSYQHEDDETRTIKLRRVLRASERWFDKDGPLLTPDIEVEGWWTSLSSDKEKVIELYQGHALCEQYHSELKTDLDLERLPSGKFATNALVMSCAGLAYNLLRAIGQIGLMDKKQARRAKQRRRLKTVLQDLMYFAARFLRHAHGLALRFSCHAHWQTQAFTKIYERFAYG